MSPVHTAIPRPSYDDESRCTSCGYMRRGLASGHPCPECGADPAEVPTATHTPGSLSSRVESVRACLGCGMALHGVVVGDPCPGCGRQVAQRSTRGVDDPLCMAPDEVVRALRFGAWTAAACVLAFGVLLGLSRFEVLGHGAGTVGGVLVAALWCVGLWWLTAPIDTVQSRYFGITPESPLRQAARWMQWGWVLDAGAPLLGDGSGLAGAAHLIGSIVGVAGLVVAAVYLMRLAQWVRDDSAYRTLNMFAWVAPLVAIGSGLWDGGSSTAAQILTIVLSLFPLVLLVIFTTGVMMLSRSIDFSAIHRQEHVEHQKTMLRRHERYTDEAVAAVHAVDAAQARSEGARSTAARSEGDIDPPGMEGLEGKT